MLCTSHCVYLSALEYAHCKAQYKITAANVNVKGSCQSQFERCCPVYVFLVLLKFSFIYMYFYSHVIVKSRVCRKVLYT